MLTKEETTRRSARDDSRRLAMFDSQRPQQRVIPQLTEVDCPPQVANRRAASVSRRLPAYLLLRYWIDRSVALFLLALTWPVLLLVALLIRCTSAGSVLYTQTRQGFGGRDFKIYKFRSMVENAEKSTGAVWCEYQDPRVTRLGAFLRWSHLDELPQLFNILKGEMALIGPRPERPEIAANLEKRIENYRERLNVLPGVTGLAQVTLPPDSNLTSVRCKTLLDCEYVHTASLALDIHILFATSMLLFGLQRKLTIRSWQTFFGKKAHA